MASDEKDDKGDLDLNESTDVGEDITQTESFISSEAGPELDVRSDRDEGAFSDDYDVDITGDEDIDFADEDDDLSEGGGFSLKKIMAPALVLVVAAGVGGYILMNPQILGQGSAPALPISENPYVAQSSQDSSFIVDSVPRGGTQEPAEDITETTDFSHDSDSFKDSPPQPLVNQNEVSGNVSEFPETTEITEIVSPPSEKVPDISVPAVSPAFSPAFSPVVAQAVSEKSAAEEKNADFGDDLSELVSLEKEGFEAKTEPAPEPNEPILFEDAVDSPAIPSSFVSKKAAFEEESEGTAAAHVAPSKAPSVAAETYFDGKVPTGPLATAVGPRKLNPVLEPATQFVVVKKNYDAKDAESVLVAANRALKLKRYEAALDMFNQLYEKNPRDPRILMGRAVAQQNTGLTESALKTYEELLSVKPKDSDAMLNMLGLLRKQYPSVALRRLMELYKIHPNNAGIAAQIGVTQADLGHYDDAMRYLGIASSLEPENAQHAFNMAIISDRNGQTRNAVRYYEQALEMDAVYARGRSIPRETIYDRLSLLRRR